jgi:glyoxylase-like metal-dependent hydrolase (beta-lactamase superfamily II)
MNPELDYLKAVNSVAPPADPQLLFLLMAAYGNANRPGDGAAFLTARLQDFALRMTAAQKALYLSAIGLLRAQNAPSVPLFRRVGYVKAAIAMLDEAKTLTDGEVFVVNWVSGVVRSRLPGFFGQRQTAEQDLAWCQANIDKAPHARWLRDVKNSPVTLTTPLGEDRVGGHTFSPRRIREVVPGRIFQLSGFEFTEYYFVRSDDGKELIGIDAGTRADSAQAAYEALRAYTAGLPPLTAIFVTHAHWDHVGGQRYFRGLDPAPRFYARSNYREEIAGELNLPDSIATAFFGERFNLDDVRTFAPDVTIEGSTDLRIGETRIDLIPVDGGETLDAMLVHLPELGVLFAGDFIMPYIGAPFVNEGNIQGLFDAIDVVVEKRPTILLHGHTPITESFKSTEILASIKLHLTWLRDEVLAAIHRGEARSAIHEANLIPPGLLDGPPDVHLPYLVLREHVIDRVFRQNVGYWQANLEGLDHLGDADHGDLLANYLGLSEKRVARAANALIADGKFELAGSLLKWATAQFGASVDLAKAERLTYLKLMEKYQNFDPFKYILYSSKIGEYTT